MKFILPALIFLTSLTVKAGPISVLVVLDGGGFLQSGSVTNTSPVDTMTGVIYSLGTAADGIATWDTGTGGGTASDFLSNPRWFQTVTFSGLSVAPGGVFNFSGLDIDLIAVLAPLSIDEGTISPTGASLAHASVTALFDGRSASGPLNQTDWQVTQTLVLSETTATPEPSSSLLFGSGLFAVVVLRRKFAR